MNRWPAEDAAPEQLLRAAETLAERPVASEQQPWAALPVRGEAVPSAGERRAAIARLLAWAQEGGARWDGIEFVVDAAGGASVRALRAIAVGERVLALPLRLMIVDDKLANSATGELGVANPRDALAAWLPLEVRAPGSRWRAYLGALPVQLPELPMFHDANAIGALAGTAALALAEDHRRDLLRAYGELPAELRERVSLADFAWGWAIVRSRGYHAPGTLHRLALVPLVDLFDHRPGDTTWTYDPFDGLFEITTERAFAPGDAVHISYGDLSNSRLLVQYGFAAPGNDADEAALVFDRAADPVNDVAAHLLWNMEMPAPVFVAGFADQRFVRALSLSRLQASGPTERTRAAAVGLGPHGDLPWLGPAHEESALAVMAAAARRALAELAAPRPGATDDPWSRTCLLVRDSERALLEQLVEFATTAAEHVRAREPASARAAADAIPANATGARRLLGAYLDFLAGEL